MRLPLDTLLKNDSLEISWIEGKGPLVFLSFTGIGHGMGAIQMPEFVGTSSSHGNAAAFISDRHRSWYNNFDFQLIADVLSPHIGDRSIISIGNSMGGFGAVLATQYFPITKCLSFVPQFSVNPAVVPDETRWTNFRSRIKQFRHDDLGSAFNSTTQYFLFSGGTELELVQARRFPTANNITHIVFQNVHHDVTGVLKKRGELTKLIWDIVNGDEASVQRTLAQFQIYRMGSTAL